MSNSRQTIEQWNNRVSNLEEYITREFPKGCEAITCDECIFGPDTSILCDFVWKIKNDMEANKSRRTSGRKKNYLINKSTGSK